MKNTEELNDLSRPHTTLKTNLQCNLVIALCFFWTSTGYLSWMYHLLDFMESTTVDCLTEVVGYLFQAFGIFAFSLIMKQKKGILSNKSIFITFIGVDFIFIILATLSNHLLFILIWGYLMNFVHGIIAGFYLALLASQVEMKYRSIVFGGAYAVSSIASWLLSLVDQSSFLRSEYAL